MILHNENGRPFEGFRSLSGRGVAELLRNERPRAALISQFQYAYDWAAYRACLRLGIPIWIRHETQDEAFVRPAWKAGLRNLFYRAAYRGVSHAFYIGELNREHLVRHGIPARRMSRAAYCAPTGAETNPGRQQEWRMKLRGRLGIDEPTTLLLFSGKLVEKKNPELVLEAWDRLTEVEKEKFALVFVGTGPLEQKLRARAADSSRIHFAGFINQSEIVRYYAAADILTLPSRRAGETWGLVVNEALQAGCAVVMTDAVGCHREFGGWERVRVIHDGDASALLAAWRELARFPRQFDWCASEMENYSIDAAASALVRQIDLLA
jgi:glycosyltransferase involved in cell wall biosynthesis